MLDYVSLSAVAQVVREGSFERAAQALHVTASAVSQRVKLLEERLGLALIVRGTPCTATEAGHWLCRHVEQVGMLERDLHTALPALTALDADDGRVTLRIAVNADSLATWFIDAAQAFTQAEPALLDLSADDQDHTAEWLREGTVLAAVSSSTKPVQGCHAVPLGQMRYVASASPEYVHRHFPNGLTAAALANAPCLSFNRKDQLQATWARRASGEAVTMPQHWLPSSQGFVQAALAGMGWGMNPMAMVAGHLKSGALVRLLPGPENDLLVPLVWQHARLKIPMLDRLTAAVQKAAGQALEP
ncbi:LysR family transcriptional regulator [Rhodoferax koreense]|uniref:LysR family transcriptional regulator n=1 Tax=Rhodoferax koreensis TaxID=1842727 RepID=A0A1P8JQ32_9BURK|nr:LysR family transcriptional regulator ArgP [Rhodoferax koreense]APW35832.1 LysR family transcriptional regulator [Rhodoferax koreense]